MTLSINTNLNSLFLQHSSDKSMNAVNLAIKRMTTGYKINSARDNAAGYSVINKMRVALGSYDVALTNVSQGLSMLETGANTLSLLKNNMQRLRDLALQAKNDTYGPEQINSINLEAQSIIADMERVRRNTEYNGINLFESTVPPPTGTIIRTVGLENTSSESITCKKEVLADRNAKLRDVSDFTGFDDVYIGEIETNNIVATQTFSEVSTLGEFIDFFNDNGVDAELRDGVISINLPSGIKTGSFTYERIFSKLGITISWEDAEICKKVAKATNSQPLYYPDLVEFNGNATNANFYRLGNEKSFNVEESLDTLMNRYKNVNFLDDDFSTYTNQA